jgi:SnoaL-like domain
MRRFILSLLICTVSLSGCGSDQKMSEDGVLRALAALDEAESKKDPAAMFRLLAEDFTITSKWPDGTVRARMALPEYKAFLTELFTKAADYKHSHGKVTVQVAEDGKTATAQYETFQHEERADKGSLAWSNLETDMFVLRDGKILLRTVETVAKTPSQMSPGDRAIQP